MKILLAGDWHGNDIFVNHLFENMAIPENVDVVFQLGDFGFWEHREEGKIFLDRISKIATDNQIPVYWLDGNHENHELLKTYVKDNNSFAEIRENVFYSPRGHTWAWDNITFMSFGGAYSIDKNVRTPYVSWWPEEIPSDDEVKIASSKGKVDVLLTHDCPSGYDVLKQSPWPLETIEGALHSRNQVGKVAFSVEPKRIYHGHYHFYYEDVWDAPWGKVDICCLDSDYTASYWHQVYKILDTSEFV